MAIDAIRHGDLILVSSQSLGVRGLYCVDRLDPDGSIFASDPDGDDAAIHVRTQDVVSVFSASSTRK